jgi:Mn2+/Fe2+ NRAMP family transporter
MRFLFFLAVLGVVVAGNTLAPGNPPASAFQIAAGEIGFRIFGVILWAAAITSVVGAAYTSVSFLKTLFPIVGQFERYWIMAFIIASAAILSIVGRPVLLLVLAGAVNGLILPLSLTCMLLAAYRKDIIGDYKHPIWLAVLGWIVVVFTAWMSWGALRALFG